MYARTKIELLKIYLKGGEGSGNFGHAGCPGQIGGSGSGDVEITNLEDPKPRQAFGKGLYNVEITGTIYHSTTIDGAYDIVENYRDDRPTCCSTPNSQKLIDKGYDGVVLEYKVNGKKGLYTPYDADAGKNYGYDEFRTNLDNMELEAIYMTDESYEVFQILLEKDLFNNYVEEVDYEFIDRYRFLLNFEPENIRTISQHPKGAEFCNVTSSRETDETLETLRQL